jgi:hypothetical protein
VPTSVAEPSDARRVADALARGRSSLALFALAFPGLATRLTLGFDAPSSRIAFRLVGARDLVLGLGGLTSVRERTADAEWVGSGALADGIDALVLLATPRLALRARLWGLIAAGAAVAGFVAARELAEEREAEQDAQGR